MNGRKVVFSCLVVLILLLLVIIVAVTPRRLLRLLNILETPQTNVSALLYKDLDERYQPNEPRVYAELNLSEELDKLLKLYPEVSLIVEHRESYPEDLLAAMCNNPEMIPFVLTDVSMLEKMVLAEEENKRAACPLYLQWDLRWGYHSYGSSFVALTGCGPVCLAMITEALIEDSQITPVDVAEYSMEKGYYVPGVGTDWSLLYEGCLEFGIKAKEIDITEDSMKWHLDRKHPLICSVGPGDFTSSGHFIVIYDYNQSGFLVNDPNCVERSLRIWTFEELESQIRKMWAYQKK